MTAPLLNLQTMTKVALAELAKERGIDLKNVSKTPKSELISIIGQAVNAANGNKRQRITNAVNTLFDIQTDNGDNILALKEITQDDFLNTVLAVVPAWKQAGDEAQIKRHFGWYKSTYRKLHGALIRPRLSDEVKAERLEQAAVKKEVKAADKAKKVAAKAEKKAAADQLVSDAADADITETDEPIQEVG